MKKVITLLLVLLSLNIYGQRVHTLRIVNVFIYGNTTFHVDASMVQFPNHTFMIGEASNIVEKVHGKIRKATVYLQYKRTTDGNIRARTIRVKSGGYLIALHHYNTPNLAHELSHVNFQSMKGISQVIDEGIAITCQYVASGKKEVGNIECANNYSVAHNDGKLSKNPILAHTQFRLLAKTFSELYQKNPNAIKQYYQATRKDKKLLQSWKKSLAFLKKMTPTWNLEKHYVLKDFQKPAIFWVTIPEEYTVFVKSNLEKKIRKVLWIYYRTGRKTFGTKTMSYCIGTEYNIAKIQPTGYSQRIGAKVKVKIISK